jgi:hypothetical protein
MPFSREVDMKFLAIIVVAISVLLTACATTSGRSGRISYGTSNDCQAILNDWYGGPDKLPPGCIEREEAIGDDRK